MTIFDKLTLEELRNMIEMKMHVRRPDCQRDPVGLCLNGGPMKGRISRLVVQYSVRQLAAMII